VTVLVLAVLAVRLRSWRGGSRSQWQRRHDRGHVKGDWCRARNHHRVR